MAEVSAKDVAALRKATGAGMMDCKKALEETDGDIERPRTGCARRASPGRASAPTARPTEGAVEVLVDGNVGVHRRAELRDRLRRQGRRVHRRGAGARASSSPSRATPTSARCRSRARPSASTSRSSPASSARTIELGRVVRFEAADGLLDGYKHIQNDRGTIGVLVELGGVDPSRREGAGGRARHRAAHRVRRAARTSRRDDVPADVVERERAVLEEQTPQRGQARASVAEDRRGPAQRRSTRTIVLLEQAFVKDPKSTIGKLVEGLGGDATRRAASPASRSARTSVRAHEWTSMPRASTAAWCSSSRVRRSPTRTIGFGIDADVVQRIAEEVAEARARARRRDRDRRRRRQHLAGHVAARPAAWTAPAPTTWACSPP